MVVFLMRRSDSILMQTLKIVLALVVSLLAGVIVMMITDSIADPAVEKNVRRELATDVRQALNAFEESAGGASSDAERFVRKYVATIMKDRVAVYEHTDPPAAKDHELYLDTLREPRFSLDLYLKEAYLRSKQTDLDVVDYVAGLTAVVVSFTFIVLSLEYRRRKRSLQHQFDVKHAELDAALRQHEALTLLGRMSAALAHELKTPIATIFNLIQTFPSRQSDEQFVSRFLALTREELTRTQQLIDNLLTYGKEIDIRNNEWVSLGALLRKHCANGIALDMPRDIAVFGDAFYLNLLLKNLVRNSAEAGADAISVRLAAAADGQGTAMIVLEDNGSGFSPSVELDKLTDPFVTSRSRGGGLGLYLARKIAVAHGGTFALERMEKGARVVMLFPADRIKG